MLTILLRILSVIGMILLVLLAVILILLLLVLFVPVTYRISATRKPEGEEPVFQNRLSVKVNWLLGLLRIRYAYPKPGEVTVKVLFLTLYRAALPKGGEDGDTGEAPQKSAKKTPDAGLTTDAEPDSAECDTSKSDIAKSADAAPMVSQEDAGIDYEALEPESDAAYDSATSWDTTASQGTAASQDATTSQGTATSRDTETSQDAQTGKKESPFEKISSKIRGICDKIKNIKENVDYYRELFLCDDTRELLNHAFMRLGRVLKSIRPRKLTADVLFGTGSPDTTGYILGVYGMLSPGLGRKIKLTPDFEKAVLEGELYAAGHITICRLLWHGLRLLLDRRLRRLLRKLKKK